MSLRGWFKIAEIAAIWVAVFMLATVAGLCFGA
jgi:hypothetical protein